MLVSAVGVALGHFTRSGISWINQILTWVAPYGQPPCTANATVNGRDADSTASESLQ